MVQSYTINREMLEKLDDAAIDLTVNVANEVSNAAYDYTRAHSHGDDTIYLDVPAMLAELERFTLLLQSLTPDD